MKQEIKERCEIISKNFKEINAERKVLLEKISLPYSGEIKFRQRNQLGIRLHA